MLLTTHHIMHAIKKIVFTSIAFYYLIYLFKTSENFSESFPKVILSLANMISQI